MEKASETEIIDDINLETWRKFFRMPRDRKIKRFGYKLFDYKLPRIFFGTEKQIPFLFFHFTYNSDRQKRFIPIARNNHR